MEPFYKTLDKTSKNLPSLTITATGEIARIIEIRIRNNEVTFTVETETGAYKELSFLEVQTG